MEVVHLFFDFDNVSFLRERSRTSVIVYIFVPPLKGGERAPCTAECWYDGWHVVGWVPQTSGPSLDSSLVASCSQSYKITQTRRKRKVIK